MENKKFLIIDSNSLIYRAYHALPALTEKQGENVGAVYGFLLILFKAVKEFNPEFIVACFDVKGPTFRHEKYKEYKGKRAPMPLDLVGQVIKTKEILKVFNIPVFEKQGFEADDLIGTINKLSKKDKNFPNMDVIILSGDADLLQLVDERTKVYSLRKGVKDTVLYDKELVKEKYKSLEPKQLLDYKALRGDPSDNIPGVVGIGEKSAIELLKEYGSLKNIYENIALIKGKIREKLFGHEKDAFLSRELAQIDENVDIDFSLKDCQWKNYNKENAKQVLKDFEFYSLVDRLP